MALARNVEAQCSAELVMKPMFLTAIAALSFLVRSTVANAQSLSGLRIGDDISSTSKLGAPPQATNQTGPFTMEKWVFAEGNALSVTAFRDTGKIVYLESDWGGRQFGVPSDFPGMTFGKTNLADIRTQTGNNGFAYKTNALVRVSDGLALFNCYQFSKNTRLVVAFVTKLPTSSGGDVQAKRLSVGQAAKLDALVLADMSYLETIWGKEKTFDPAYNPIDWK